MDNSTSNENNFLVRYLDNELSPGEREEMEKRIAADESLRRELEDLRIAREALVQYGLRARVADIHGSMMKELKVPVRRMSTTRRAVRYGMSIAAGVILLVGAFMAYNFFTLSADGFYLSHYRAYEVGTTRSAGADENIQNAYRDKKYNEVIGIYRTRDSSSTTGFLAAMSFLQVNDIQSAIGVLERLSSGTGEENKQFMEEAEFYLALAYVKNRDFDLALPLLEKIHDQPTHLYHEKVSSKMVRKVKMLKWR
jgi:hypothetical protein